MGITAETLGAKYEVTREECDQFALQSQQRWKAGKRLLDVLNEIMKQRYPDLCSGSLCSVIVASVVRDACFQAFA